MSGSRAGDVICSLSSLLEGCDGCRAGRVGRFPVGGWGAAVMRRVVAVFAVAVAGFAVVPQIAVGALTERVSVATDGTQANGDSVARSRR